MSDLLSTDANRPQPLHAPVEHFTELCGWRLRPDSRTPSSGCDLGRTGSKIDQFYVLVKISGAALSQTRIVLGMKREIGASDSAAGRVSECSSFWWWFYHKKLELLAPKSAEDQHGQHASGGFRIYRYHASNITEKGEPQNPGGCRVKPFYEYKTTHYRRSSCFSWFHVARYACRSG